MRIQKKHTVFISVGSNIGEKFDHCRKGIEAVALLDHTKISMQSAFYQTEPVDFTDQDWFINAVIQIETAFEPLMLLTELNKIENRAGRTRDHIRFGPRILDLDIIFYDSGVYDWAELKIPHPKMHKRRFVLKPMCDIDSKFIHPVLNKDMKTLLDNLGHNEQGVVRCS